MPGQGKPLLTILDRVSRSSPGFSIQEGPVTEVVVLGGGLAGLYAAFHLASDGVKVIVVEREFAPGGSLRTQQFHGHPYSLAESPLVTGDQQIAQTLQSLLPPNLISADAPPPVPYLRWNGNDLPLPLRLRDLLGGLPPALRSNLVLSQLVSRFRPGRTSSHSPANAAEVLRQRYGEPLCEFIIAPELQAYWGVPLTELAPAAADFPVRSLFSERSDRAAEPCPWTIHTTPGCVADRLARAIQSLGGRLFYGAEVEQVGIEPRTGCQIVIRDRLDRRGEPPSRIRLTARRVLSTIPLRALVRALGSHVPAQVHAASYQLDHLPVQAHICLVQRSSCLNHPTVHFRQRPFLRLTEPERLRSETPGTVAPSQTLLLIELAGRATQNSREAWQSILGGLEEEEICSPDEILDAQFLHWPSGVPILRRETVPALQRILTCLERFPALQTAGGSGRFTWMTPSESMASGRAAAQLLAAR